MAQYLVTILLDGQCGVGDKMFKKGEGYHFIFIYQQKKAVTSWRSFLLCASEGARVYQVATFY